MKGPKESETHKADPEKLAKQLEKKDNLKKSIEKINENLTSSNEALTKHQQHVDELKKMIKDQADGPAK